MKKEKFISIIFKSNLKESNVELLIDFLKGLIGNYINPIYQDGMLTVFFDAAYEISFKEIIQSLNEDFYITALLFESGELYKEVDKNEYINFIKECKEQLFKINSLYITEADLIKNKVYKDVITRNILKDYYDGFDFYTIFGTFNKKNKEIFMEKSKVYFTKEITPDTIIEVEDNIAPVVRPTYAYQLNEGKIIDVSCQFCDKIYTFTPDDLRKLMKG